MCKMSLTRWFLLRFLRDSGINLVQAAALKEAQRPA
jgi:hypothetical protein